MTVTPLQLARFYAMIANGGRLVTPHVFKDVTNPSGVSIVPRPTQPTPKKIDVSASALQVVREGLFRATHDPDGTSTAIFSSFPVEIAGKTGTAEKWSSEYNRYFDQAWWCGLRSERRARDRRLRADRERRPRRHVGGAGRARGPRELLPHQAQRGRRGQLLGDGLMAVDYAGARRRNERTRRLEGAEAFARRFDWILFGSVVALVAYGIHLVAGITRDDVPDSPDYYVIRQAIYAAVGGVGMLGVSLIDPDYYRRYWRQLYAVSLLLLLLVIPLGTEARGSSAGSASARSRSSRQSSESCSSSSAWPASSPSAHAASARSRRCSGRSGSSPYPGCSCSSSRTSARRSCTARHSSRCSSSRARAGCTSA
jgi:membrane peptidoglycan carboxypeptidase